MGGLGAGVGRHHQEVANRFGNPSIGPAFEYNETSVAFAGMWLFTPLPVFNTRRGEILQGKAEWQRAKQEAIQFEVQAQQEVQAALARLADARAWAASYENEVLPTLSRGLKEMEKLLAQGDPGVDVLRLIDVQRRHLRALDLALDVRFEVSQALADLAAAAGDPSLVIAPPPAPPTPPAPPAQALPLPRL